MSSDQPDLRFASIAGEQRVSTPVDQLWARVAQHEQILSELESGVRKLIKEQEAKTITCVLEDGTLFCGTIDEYQAYLRVKVRPKQVMPPAPTPQPTWPPTTLERPAEPGLAISVPPGSSAYGVNGRWRVEPVSPAEPRESSAVFAVRVIVGAIVAGLTASLTMAWIHS